jgi:hypothetical protein
MLFHRTIITLLLTVVGDLPSCLGSSTLSGNNPACRYLPGDHEWPTQQEWDELNKTVHGQLIATIPLGSACHDPTYNATECSYLQKEWPYAQTQ